MIQAQLGVMCILSSHKNGFKIILNQILLHKEVQNILEEKMSIIIFTHKNH